MNTKTAYASNVNNLNIYMLMYLICSLNLTHLTWKCKIHVGLKSLIFVFII